MKHTTVECMACGKKAFAPAEAHLCELPVPQCRHRNWAGSVFLYRPATKREESKISLDNMMRANWEAQLMHQSKTRGIFSGLSNDYVYGEGVLGRKKTEEELEQDRINEIQRKSRNLWHEVELLLEFEPHMTRDLDDDD